MQVSGRWGLRQAVRSWPQVSMLRGLRPWPQECLLRGLQSWPQVRLLRVLRSWAQVCLLQRLRLRSRACLLRGLRLWPQVCLLRELRLWPQVCLRGRGGLQPLVRAQCGSWLCGLLHRRVVRSGRLRTTQRARARVAAAALWQAGVAVDGRRCTYARLCSRVRPRNSRSTERYAAKAARRSAGCRCASCGGGPASGSCCRPRRNSPRLGTGTP